MSSAARSFVLAALLAGCAHQPPAPPEPATPPPAEAPAAAAAETPTAEAPAPEPSPAPAPEPLPRPEQATGPYGVSVASERTTQLAGPWVRRLEAEGLRVEIQPATVAGATWQRVVLPGLRNGREARAMVAYLDQQLGLKGAWVLPKAAPAAAGEASPKPQGERPEN